MICCARGILKSVVYCENISVVKAEVLTISMKSLVALVYIGERLFSRVYSTTTTSTRRRRTSVVYDNGTVPATSPLRQQERREEKEEEEEENATEITIKSRGSYERSNIKRTHDGDSSWPARMKIKQQRSIGTSATCHGEPVPTKKSRATAHAANVSNVQRFSSPPCPKLPLFALPCPISIFPSCFQQLYLFSSFLILRISTPPLP
ncbi:hypothetical protein PV327_003986 [Microctonus hyperodae]|uniref:Uncharacterized protein n=1 Tax=Microctonus hyperodae TaxID=165561 RepID=A0AA39G604_MICHY|nr:hypothetical protein PV327_003986 [Microctonus hyperodae]